MSEPKYSKEQVERAKSSCAVGFKKEVLDKKLYDKVSKGVANNVKMGPFTATSGVVLPYYLNLSTNFLDKDIAGDIVRVLTMYMEKDLKPYLLKKSGGKPILAVGMEVAGGMMACHFAGQLESPLFKWMDFVYMRKEKKTSGTLQQLEGPQKFTSRKPDSEVLYGIWLDDCLSTGGSMTEGIKALKKDYNIEVIASVFLVDRSKDRSKLPEHRLHTARSMYDDFKMFAVYDLKEIHELVPKK